MKIIFANEFYNSGYADDTAAAPGRMEAIMNELAAAKEMIIIEPAPAEEKDIEAVHDKNYIAEISKNDKLFRIAALAAGGAISAAMSAVGGEPAFACIRPPGHHAYAAMGWGHCYFNNMAIALEYLKIRGLIKNAFIIDIDAHTGDGTLNLLSKWENTKILNPYAEKASEYLTIIEEYISELGDIDVVAVCAGFDAYEKDLGKKLATFDFYRIGYLMKKFSKKLGHGRRFAILEGGYYLPDLGKNVLAFCQGFG